MATKTIEELFKTKILSDGKTAAEKYDIRNSKELPLSSATGAMTLPFKAAQIVRRNLSSKTTETRIEGEVTGLRIISKLAAPVIYGTDIFRLSTQSTDMVKTMKDSVNPTDGGNAGVLGNTFNKAKSKGLELAKKIGIEFPENMIPTKIKANDKFIKGKESDTMVTLAEIKKDAAGNLIGKLLAKNAKGTPNQIGNQVLGAGIGLLKKEVKKKLFGAPKQGAQNLAAKSEEEVQYDSTSKYSNTVQPALDDDFVTERNDLSSLLKMRDDAKAKNQSTSQNGEALKNPPTPDAKKSLGNITTPDGLSPKDTLSALKKENAKSVAEGRKEAQQRLAKKAASDGDSIRENKYDNLTSYNETVDATNTDINLRNDASSLYESALDLNERLIKKNEPVKYKKLPRKQGKTKFTKKVDTGQNTSLQNRYKIDTNSNLLNEKLPYAGPKLKISDDTTLDDYDFIPLKFTSVTNGRKINTVNFMATITGLTENVSPTWDTAKFLGSSFNYYNYTGIERSVTFSFIVYSTNAVEHVAAWQRINFLTQLAYPQGYNQGYMIPPFIKLTLGNLYVNKECFIESLSYNVDDNGGWEIGSANKTKNDFAFGNENIKLNDFKLPRVITVDMTLKFVESVNNTYAGELYGFKKINGSVKLVQNNSQTSNQEKTADANSSTNNDERISTMDGEVETPTLQQPKPQQASQTNVNTSGQPQSEKVAEVPKVENASATKTATKSNTKGKFEKKFITAGPPNTILDLYTDKSTEGIYTAKAYDSLGKSTKVSSGFQTAKEALDSLEAELSTY